MKDILEYIWVGVILIVIIRGLSIEFIKSFKKGGLVNVIKNLFGTTLA